MTPGTDGITLDGISLKYLEQLQELIYSDRFQPSPIRRIYIPKKNGKMRPLGIGSPRDKIVEQAFLFILESVLEPKFSDLSHGFRPNRGCHTALRQLRYWNGVSWFIEGDIKDFFSTIDHHILADKLKLHFKDTRLMNLYWKFARAGYVEWDNDRQKIMDLEFGVPQGSIISPILSNLYLHDLDTLVQNKAEAMIRQNEGLKNPYIKNPAYNSLTLKIKRRYDKIKQMRQDPHSNSATLAGKKKEIRKLVSLRRRTKSVINNPSFGPTIKFVRYADDWLIGIWGKRQDAVYLREEIKRFLADHLGLELNLDKTLITNARSGRARFLGLNVKRNTTNSISRLRNSVNNPTYKGSKHRSTRAGQILMTAPILDIIKRLVSKEFLDIGKKKEWRSKSIPHLLPLPIRDIILRYKTIFNGYKNYYNFVDNIRQLRKIHWILKESLIKTLSRKLDRGRRDILRKFGRNIQTMYKLNKTIKKINFACPPLSYSPMHFLGATKFRDPTTVSKWKIRTLNLLDAPCANCNSRNDVQVHHLRHIKTINLKLNAFDQKLAAINRKQVPLCHTCHKLVHQGKYKGMSLKHLANSR